MRMLRLLYLLTLPASIGACEGILVPAANSNQNVADFEATWMWVDSVYPVFEAKQIDWDAVYASYRPASENASGDEFYQVLHDMLAELRDAHLYYQTPGGGVVFPHYPPRWRRDRHAFSPHLVRAYIDRELHLAGGKTMEYEMMDGNIGYFRLSTFSPEDMMDDLPVVMQYVQDTDALIIDVRNSKGGRSENVAAVVGWFIEEPFSWMMAVEQDWVPFEPWLPIEPIQSGYRYTKPVVVLTNGVAISAAELFTEVMKQVSNVTIVGDTTAGAGCNDRDVFEGERYLPSGKLIHIPTGCILRYDGVLLEWNGVAPDIRVPQTEADILAGRDRQLEYAIELLR